MDSTNSTSQPGSSSTSSPFISAASSAFSSPPLPDESNLPDGTVNHQLSPHDRTNIFISFGLGAKTEDTWNEDGRLDLLLDILHAENRSIDYGVCVDIGPRFFRSIGTRGLAANSATDGDCIEAFEVSCLGKLKEGIHSLHWARTGTTDRVSIPKLKSLFHEQMPSGHSDIQQHSLNVGVMFEDPSSFRTDLRTILQRLNPEKSPRDKNSGIALGRVFHFDLSKRELGLRPALGIDRSDAIPNGHATFRQYFLQKSKSEQDVFTKLCSSLGIHPQREDGNYWSRLKKEIENVGSYFYGHLLVTFPGHLFKVQITPYRLHRIIHHHRGKPVHWIIVPSSHKTQFEERLRVELAEWFLRPPNCSQCVNHLNCWIDPLLLASWGIKHFEIIQEKSQVMVLFPDTYFWAWSEGGAILETGYHFARHWGTGATDMKDYVECVFTNPAVNEDKETKQICKFHPRAELDFSTPNDEWLYGDAAGQTQTAGEGFEKHLQGLSGDLDGPTN